MGIFNNDARQFKFDLLREIARRAYQEELTDEGIQAYTKTMVPGYQANYRCCVYKEREVLRQRARLAMGKMAEEGKEYNPRQIVQVIDAACDGCTIRKIQVTNNCRKCMAKRCIEACHFGAIHIGTDSAQIDYDKCKECGACARSCPYNAIVVTERPCASHCPVDAISWNSDGIAVIDEQKCINCGQCLAACPFGAIEDISWIVPVIQLLGKASPTYAIVAPSIQGQFGDATLMQIMKGIKMLGFREVYEVAIGADAVAYHEYEELKEHIEEGVPMTTSCCPAFVNMLRMHFPDQYEKNMSTTVSPMVALARKLKLDHPGAGVVFIGPCIAKKQEAMESFANVDYVLAFDEVLAMLSAKHIDCESLEVKTSDMATNYARGFAQGGGVSKAVAQVAAEKGDPAITAMYADGCFECKKQLMLMKAGKFNFNILEGMSCQGGCINGPAAFDSINKVKARVVKENATNTVDNISENVAKMDFSYVPMHREK
ncbi:MAG: 4Fe-4S dicluster domain-containing protein [Erysipelotrichaceae bacterium]|nr:4Fe-4S dicluster domain-containing protein [Erysipelotrichaceae bacterium]